MLLLSVNYFIGINASAFHKVIYENSFLKFLIPIIINFEYRNIKNINYFIIL